MVELDLQNDDNFEAVPGIEKFRCWVEASVIISKVNLEQTIRIVDEAESEALNGKFRGKFNPTNVLSFPADSPFPDYDNFGDLVICQPVIEREAMEQAKDKESHWAHMVVHGMLHLQGLAHENEDEAGKMEALEIKILSTLGYSNPYNCE
jgi:probable rRNA maturation factor